jgi:RNA polymerase sigma-70 factor (ECF subfamily)
MHRDLVEQAMAGDRDAFTELTRLSISKPYAIARLILRDNQRAEDATQEALVAAWRQLSALRDPDRFDAWLRRLLVWRRPRTPSSASMTPRMSRR